MSVKNENGLTLETGPTDRAIEVIKLIAQAEDSGRKRREFAESEAKLILSDAAEKAKKTAALEESRAEETIKKVRELTEQKGRELAIGILTQVQGECDAMKENARQNKSDALTAVVERIVNEWR